MSKIAIIGTGTFATSVAYQLSLNKKNKITLFGRDEKQVIEINENHTNKKYFNSLVLKKRIRASNKYEELINFKVVIIAIPSGAILNLDEVFKNHINKATLIVNMSKGLLLDGNTTYEYFKSTYGLENFVSLKGASFSSELINNHPSLLTLGYETYRQSSQIRNLIDNTDLYLDYTTDINGVEYLSALKNIYAIYIGNIDAKYNSHNTRYFLLTQCYNEIKKLLKHLKCESNTIALGCGLGDFCLTSLSDLSRNRTLGLMVGKGFYDGETASKSVVVEGIRTLKLLNNSIDEKIVETLPILKALLNYFIKKKADNLDINFLTLLKKQFKTVLTYGTFDLLHYGHLEILKRSKSFGDRLIVGLSSDEFNKQKGKVCEFSYEKRKKYLESLDYVDVVIPENDWEQKIEDVKKHSVDYFVMGDDWKGKFDFLKEYCEVIYLPRTEGISTTQIKQILKNNKK